MTGILHSDTLYTIKVIADAYDKMGQTSEAEQYGMEYLDALSEKSGLTTPLPLSTKQLLLSPSKLIFDNKTCYVLIT